MEEIQLLIIGSLFILTGIFLFFTTKGLRSNGVITQAKIITHKIETDDEGSMLYEVFQFKDKNGITHHTKSSIGNSIGLYSKGETIDIVYDADNPKKALPNKPYLLHLYLFPVVLGMVLIITHFIITKP